MNNLPVSRTQIWRARLQRLRSRVRQTAPFAGGVLAALTALLLYSILFPAPKPLTANEVSDTVASALASATPPPAFSEQVYAIIRPSLVLVETQSTDQNGNAERGLGSGLI